MVTVPSLKFERALWGDGVALVAGVDEVGRAPLAGPVGAGAVILPPLPRLNRRYAFLRHVRDSKQLTAQAREELSGYIWEHALAAGVGLVSSTCIDRIGIAEASRQAMLLAIGEMSVRPQHLLIDAFRIPACRLPQTNVIDGDEKIASISCASIIAKVHRDRMMRGEDETYPGYGFVRNKGYPTREHFAGLNALGPCPLHRRSFAPIREMVAGLAALSS